MAKTGKERSADYRTRKKESKTEAGHDIVQMNLYVSAAHRSVLRQVSQRHSVTMEQMLAKIIDESRYVKEFEQDKTDFLSGRFSNANERGSDSP